jgi:hypothetical protein
MRRSAHRRPPSAQGVPPLPSEPGKEGPPSVPHGRLPSSHSGECGDCLHARPGPAPAIARSTLRRNPGSRPLSREAICRRGHGRSRRLCAVQRRRSRPSAVGRRSRSVQSGVVRHHPRGMDQKPPRQVRRPNLTTDVRAQRDGEGVPRSGLRSRPRNIEHRLPARCERRPRGRHSLRPRPGSSSRTTHDISRIACLLRSGSAQKRRTCSAQGCSAKLQSMSSRAQGCIAQACAARLTIQPST